MNIIGLEDINYTNKQGNEVKGIKFYGAEPVLHGEGCKGMEIFISAKSPLYEKASKLTVGAKVEFYYDRWGNPVHIC